MSRADRQVVPNWYFCSNQRSSQVIRNDASRDVAAGIPIQHSFPCCILDNVKSWCFSKEETGRKPALNQGARTATSIRVPTTHNVELRFSTRLKFNVRH